MIEKMFSEEQMREARRYALCLIGENPGFKAFAVNMLDYMGEEFCPHLKELYKEHSNFLFEEGLPQDDLRWVDSLDDFEILSWFENFKQREQKEKEARKARFSENIDELQFLVDKYRNSKEFQEMLDFVGKFKHLAPYNAMLVEMQKPGARMVMKAKEWVSFDRMVKPNAQQLIILRQFGPIQCVFELSDTEPIPGRPVTEEAELLERFNKSLMSAEGDIPQYLLQRLIDNLPSYGVYLDKSFNAANTYGGYIKPYRHQIQIPLGLTLKVMHDSQFLISVNRNQKPVDQFQTICHELGHLFCRHQSYDPNKKRDLSIKEREFEAETVAWLVCKRHGIKNPSEEYLAGYAPTGEIPMCSTDYVLKAVTEIEKMLKGTVYGHQSLWYSDNKDFKNFVNAVRQHKNEKKSNSPIVAKTKTASCFEVPLQPLPFATNPNQVIYVEKEYNEKINRFILEHYYSIKNRFREAGREFIYIPKLVEELRDKAVRQYNVPYAEGYKDLSIGSDCLLQFLSRPSQRESFSPSLVFFTSARDKSGNSHQCKGIALNPDSEYLKCDDLSFALADINRYSKVEKESYDDLSAAYSDSLSFASVDAQRPFSSDILSMLDEAKSIVEKLRKSGVEEYVLEQMILGEQKLSHLHITKDYRIFLTDYDNTEITMGPLPKTVFLFFLRHEEGVRFKYLVDYKEELKDLYHDIVKDFYSESSATLSIDNLTNPTNNSINENCSRIRKAFISKFNERLAQNYFIVGDRTEAKRITLPRNLVVWDE